MIASVGPITRSSTVVRDSTPPSTQPPHPPPNGPVSLAATRTRVPYLTHWAFTAAILAAIAVASAGNANANAVPFTTPAPLSAGHAATITVNNKALTWKTFVVMPGADFIPTTGRCYTHLRFSAGYLPRNVWDCRDLSGPITFSSPDVAATDLTPDPSNSLAGFGYVGLIGTGGMSRGAWTLSVPLAKFDYQTTSAL